MTGAPTSKKVFLTGLTSEEQLGTIWDMCQSIRSEQASDRKERIDTRNEMTYLKGEVDGIAHRNGGKQITLTTSQKIDVAITKRSVVWVWYRDRVLAPTLAAVHTLVIMAILYLAFGGKIP